MESELLLSVAFSVTDSRLLRMPATTVKLADLAPPATVTEAGVVNNKLLSDRKTTTPPAGAV